jgi:phosphoheptose isomerase
MTAYITEDRMSSLGLTLLHMKQDEGLMKDIDQVGLGMRDKLSKDKKIFICGNGGSFSQAVHFSAEFVRDKQVIALMSNPAAMTAVSNDIDYSDIFATELDVCGDSGDLLIALTTSGSSLNVINAMSMAKSKGMIVVLLTGEAPCGEALRYCDWQFRIPSNNTQLIQEVHLNILHTWMSLIQGGK